MVHVSSVAAGLVVHHTETGSGREMKEINIPRHTDDPSSANIMVVPFPI